MAGNFSSKLARRHCVNHEHELIKHLILDAATNTKLKLISTQWVNPSSNYVDYGD